jgi:hypothetical protein
VTYNKRTIMYTIEYKLHLGLLFTCEHLNLKWQIHLIFILQTKKTSAEIHKREEIIIHPRSKKYSLSLNQNNKPYIFYKSNTKSTCNEFMNQRKILHQNNNSTFRASMQMGHLDVQTTAISTSQFHKPKGQQDAGIMANKYTVC